MPTLGIWSMNPRPKNMEVIFTGNGGGAVCHVNTEYDVICTDKEFLNPDIIIQGLVYLCENPDYQFARGLVYNIIMSNNKMCLKAHNTGRTSLTSANPTNRFLYSSVNTPPWANNELFSITRSDTHKKIYELMVEYGVNDLRYGEILISYIGQFYGKCKSFIGDYYKIRDEIHINNVRNSSHLFGDGMLKKIC